MGNIFSLLYHSTLLYGLAGLFSLSPILFFPSTRPVIRHRVCAFFVNLDKIWQNSLKLSRSCSVSGCWVSVECVYLEKKNAHCNYTFCYACIGTAACSFYHLCQCLWHINMAYKYKQCIEEPFSCSIRALLPLFRLTFSFFDLFGCHSLAYSILLYYSTTPAMTLTGAHIHTATLCKSNEYRKW